MNNVCVKIIPSVPKELSISSNDIIKVVINSLVKLDHGLTNDQEIEIIFAEEEEIRMLNLKHRKIDAPTDVLSFPQTNIKESLVNILGSVVICPKKVFEKNEEVADVIKHGLLHLLGYDHETNEEKWDAAALKINCKL